MGYEIHITRRDVSSDDEEPSIPLQEWLSYVDNDPSIEPDPENLTDPPENFIISTHPERRPLWYNLRRGYLHTKNPDNQMIGKMVEIATALGARVQGDDGEYYEDDSGVPVDCEGLSDDSATIAKPWWKFW